MTLKEYFTLNSHSAILEHSLDAVLECSVKYAVFANMVITVVEQLCKPTSFHDTVY